MKILRYAPGVLFPVSLAVCFFACGPEAPTSIDITPANPVISVQATQQFLATGTYAGGGTQSITSNVTWSSSDSAVATVNSSGLATALAAGTATITANLGSTVGSTTLTVTSGTLSSISVTPTAPTIPLQITQQFAAMGTFSDGTTHDITSQVTWTSSNLSVGTVNSSGLAMAVAVGTTTITATSGSISGNTTLTVTSATLSSVSVTPTDSNIILQATLQFTATGTFSDATTHDLASQVTWTSSNPSVATVSTTGLATAITTGTTTITATSGSISGSATLTVISATLSSISLTPLTPSIRIGATQPFAATGTFSDGTTNDLTSQVTWSSSNPTVATMSNSGLATAVAVGTATITATSGSISGNTILTVTSR